METIESVEKKTKTDFLAAFHQLQSDKLRKRNEGEDDNRSLNEKIKELATEAAEFSLFAGMSSIVRNELYVKMIWIFFHLCFTGTYLFGKLILMLGFHSNWFAGVLAFLVANNIINYLQYEVNTQVRIINQVPFIFPTITLCNLNFFQANYSIEFLQQMAKVYNMSDPFNFTALDIDTYYGSLLDYVKIGREYVAIKNISNAEVQKFAYPLNGTLLNCIFNYISCNSTYFEWFFHTQFGYFGSLKAFIQVLYEKNVLLKKIHIFSQILDSYCTVLIFFIKKLLSIQFR